MAETNVHVSRNIPDSEIKDIVLTTVNSFDKIRFVLEDDPADPSFYVGAHPLTDVTLSTWLRKLSSLTQLDIMITPEIEKAARVTEDPDAIYSSDEGDSKEPVRITLYLADTDGTYHEQPATSSSYENAVGFGLSELSEWMFRTKEGRKFIKKRMTNTIKHVPNPREYVTGVTQ